MTIEELAKTLGIETNYLRNQWNNVKRRRESQGIELVKVGRGASADYGYRTLKDEYWIFDYKERE